MNKMTKGALATGVGVALLLSGGGTLAVWNTAAEANAGTMTGGDLQMTAGTGTWTNSKGTVVKLASYRVVPGDVLTFTQPVTVAIDGDLMRASLTVTDKLTAAQASYLSVGETTLSDSVNKPVTTELNKDSDGTYTAAVKVTFKEGTTTTTGAKATNDLGKIGFKLDQIAPTS
ncbi:alternate-type signal peptide domain-containing protein [Paeniglutamicibacter antarcticus]|uniref:Alternate signal-mediated exported protein n=1 Tax=Paeniglutamicibacter antarcticus TaxID=494023 RepID=A0ABP9TNZ4_9MICC